jgi:hypothetical protein
MDSFKMLQSEYCLSRQANTVNQKNAQVTMHKKAESIRVSSSSLPSNVEQARGNFCGSKKTRSAYEFPFIHGE